MATKYIKEVAAIRRPKKAVGVSVEFNLFNEETDPPLGIYDRTFSRIVVAGIDSERNLSATANVPIEALEEIFRRTDYAFEKQMDAETGETARLVAALEANKPSESASGEDVTKSPAYTVTIANGALKGRTPADVVLKDGEKGIEALTRQYQWLKENLAKYPKNKIQMDAINLAAALYKEGKLVEAAAPAAEAVSANTVINIYNAEARALIRKKREDGMCPVHNLDIKWNVGDNNPLVITVSNFYAPVVERENGTISPQVSKRDPATVKQVQLRATSAEWNNILRAIKAAMRQFEMVNAKRCIDAAVRISKEARTAAMADAK